MIDRRKICTTSGKEMYETEAIIKEVIRYLYQNEMMNYYKCLYCGCYHLTRMKYKTQEETMKYDDDYMCQVIGGYMLVQHAVLSTALSLAIKDQEKYEKETLKYSSDSALLSSWKKIQTALDKNEQGYITIYEG